MQEEPLAQQIARAQRDMSEIQDRVLARRETSEETAQRKQRELAALDTAIRELGSVPTMQLNPEFTYTGTHESEDDDYERAMVASQFQRVLNDSGIRRDETEDHTLYPQARPDVGTWRADNGVSPFSESASEAVKRMRALSE